MRKFTLIFSLLLAIATTAMADFDFRWLATTYYGSDVALPSGASLKSGLSAAKMKEVFIRVDNKGDVAVSFTYSTADGLNCALNVVGVDLVNLKGEVAYSHYENKHAGSDGVAETYTLENVETGYYTLRYFVGYGSDDRLNATSGTVNVSNAVGYVTPVLSYSGITEYPYELPSADVENIRALSTAMTIMADVSITNTSNNSIILASTADYTAASSTNGDILGFGFGENQMRGYVRVTSGGWYSRGSVAVGDKSLAYTINGNTKAYYVDNSLQESSVSFSGTFSGHTGTNAKMYIGGVKHSTSTDYAMFNGTINRVNIYESVLTTDQMLSARKAETIMWAKAFAGENAEVDALLAEIDAATGFATISGVKTRIEKAVHKLFFDSYKGKVGYPTDGVIDTYKAAVDAATTDAEIETAKNAVYASTDINMPEDGKVYTFTFVQKNGTEYYMNCTGSAIGDPVLRTAETELPSTAAFLAKKNDDGTFTFKTYNNKYLKYPKDGTNLADSESADTKITIGKILDSGSGSTAYVYAPNDDNANLFALVCMARGERYFVVNGSNGGWDGSSAAHFEYDDSGTRRFSSAVRIEEYVAKAYTVSNQLTAADLMAKTEPVYIAIKNLSYTNNRWFVGNTGAVPYSEEEFTNDAVFVWEPVTEGEAGSYRLRKLNGDYMQTTAPKDFGAVDAAAAFTATKPTFTDDDSNLYVTGDDDANLVRFVKGSDWINVQNGANGTPEYNTGTGGWTIHYVYEVTEVPEFSAKITSAGYSTFYAPANVEIPDGINAYYITSEGVKNGYVSMTEVADIIPANTAVILEGEENDYTFKVHYAETTPVSGNLLKGTATSTNVIGDAYVLSNPSEGVGLYKTQMTEVQLSSASGKVNVFLNNAGKAYLPASAVPSTAALSAGFRFNFDGTTAIEDVEGENGAEAVYDLQGRHIDEITKPGIYVVNGKKVLVK